jgi:hypothetical protein
MLFDKQKTLNEVLELDIIKELQKQFPDEDIIGTVKETIEIAFGPPEPTAIQDGDAPKE